MRRGREAGATSCPRVADALTLSRVAAALVLLASSATPGQRRSPGWLAWCGLLWGATLSDWLDGPLARWQGPSALGPWLDLEADSLLTISASLAGFRQGILPAFSIAPPLVRYLLRFVAWRCRASTDAAAWRAWWARATGTAQMAVFLVTLAPWGQRSVRRGLRPMAGAVAALQLLSLLAQLGWLCRRCQASDTT